MAVDDIEVVQGDTDQVAQGVGTFGSRSTQLGGSAVHVAAGEVVDKAKEIAAELLEASVDDIVLDPTRVPSTWSGYPGRHQVLGRRGGRSATVRLEAEQDFNAQCSFPFGAHVAVVEVDTDTGEVRLERIVTCDDSGSLINPMIVEGQRHGGIAQGVAQALLEEVRYDDDGNPVTANFADYGIISMAELPQLRAGAAGDANRPTTRSAPRASASRGPSARRRPCRRAVIDAAVAISASVTSTAPHAPRRCGGRFGKPSA